MSTIRESLEGKYNLRVIDVEGDGNCLFRSVEAFLRTRLVGGALDAWDHRALRSATVDFIQSFRSHFAAFLPRGGDDAYLAHMRKSGTWGGEPEVVALTNLLNRSIEIYVQNPVTSHAQHERTYMPFMPFAALNEVSPIRLLYFNGTGAPVPNHYALLVPCNASNVQLHDIVNQARMYAFEKITIGQSSSSNTVHSPASFENVSTCTNVCPTATEKFDAFDDVLLVEFDDLPEFDTAATAAVAPLDDDEEVVVVLEPQLKKAKRRRSYYTAFEDNVSHGRCTYVADIMAKAEIACRTCGCANCTTIIESHEHAFEMFICKPTSPATDCQLHKIWTMYKHERR